MKCSVKMVYSPQEDSYLLANVVKNQIKNKEIKFLDLGTGSGIQTENLIKLGVKKENILAADLNPLALEKASSLGVDTIKSNLFENISGKFDLIIFNPPYLPEDKYDKEIDTTGGINGDETLIEFIKQLKKHLNARGKTIILSSSLTPELWKKEAKRRNLFFRSKEFHDRKTSQQNSSHGIRKR